MVPFRPYKNVNLIRLLSATKMLLARLTGGLAYPGNTMYDIDNETNILLSQCDFCFFFFLCLSLCFWCRKLDKGVTAQMKRSKISFSFLNRIILYQSLVLVSD